MKFFALLNYHLVVVVIGLLLFSQPLMEAAEATAEWPQFLGPNRNGLSTETGLVEAFPEGGPKIAWRMEGGVGMSGLSISQGHVVTMVQRKGKQRLVAFEAASGKPQWDTPIAPAYKNQMGDGPRATPAIAGERVFTFTGEGILAAVNLADGKLLWSREVLNELKINIADYGTACSPLVLGNQVLVIAGAPQATVAAMLRTSRRIRASSIRAIMPPKFASQLDSSCLCSAA